MKNNQSFQQKEDVFVSISNEQIMSNIGRIRSLYILKREDQDCSECLMKFKSILIKEDITFSCVESDRHYLIDFSPSPIRMKRLLKIQKNNCSSVNISMMYIRVRSSQNKTQKIYQSFQQKEDVFVSISNEQIMSKISRIRSLYILKKEGQDCYECLMKFKTILTKEDITFRCVESDRHYLLDFSPSPIRMKKLLKIRKDNCSSINISMMYIRDRPKNNKTSKFCYFEQQIQKIPKINPSCLNSRNE